MAWFIFENTCHCTCECELVIPRLSACVFSVCDMLLVCECVSAEGFPADVSCQFIPAVAQATLRPHWIVPVQDSSRAAFIQPLPPSRLQITLFWPNCNMIGLSLWLTTRHYFKPWYTGLMDEESTEGINQVRLKVKLHEVEMRGCLGIHWDHNWTKGSLFWAWSTKWDKSNSNSEHW